MGLLRNALILLSFAQPKESNKERLPSATLHPVRTLRGHSAIHGGKIKFKIISNHNKILFMKINRSSQMTFMDYDINILVREKHILRKIEKTVPFSKIAESFSDLNTRVGRKGHGVEVGLKCLFLQFHFDLSDRQLEERIIDDLAFRWFLGFNLNDATPDHTYFSRFRKIVGTKRIGIFFTYINNVAEKNNILGNIFTFIDASAIKSKETTWKERDKAIKDGEEALNNSNVNKYSADKDANFGCKGKDKFWFGYKKHVSVDMKSGLIKKVAVTPAGIRDEIGLKYICPRDSMVFGDKGYCLSFAQLLLKCNNCHSGAIMKNNMHGKNKDKDKWLSKVRAPFESVFSKQERRARYRGKVKVQMQAFLEAIVFNVKRLLVINDSLKLCNS
jgi:IS5 family transposase